MSGQLTAFIFARGGSKGLPGKNIKLLAGKPLIAWAIEAALGVDDIHRVVVSTDDDDIARVAQEFGALVPFRRPAELAGDTASELDAWRHALTEMEKLEGSLPDPFISVPTTSPLRLSEDIESCLQRYRQSDVDVVLAVTDGHRNPWFNMVCESSDGTVSTVNRAESGVTRRQDAQPVYDVTTIAYVARPSFVLEANGLFAGRTGAVRVPVERSIDIDTPLDFDIAEFLMTKRLGQS